MRKCKFIAVETGALKAKIFEGYFHGFFTFYDILLSATVPTTKAICETGEGRIFTCRPEHVTFIEPPPKTRAQKLNEELIDKIWNEIHIGDKKIKV